MPNFRPMRRIAQQLPEREAVEILKNAASGVLSLIGDNGYPYGVPLSYVYLDGKIYFHCAAAGHKLDAVRSCGKASFCVIDRDEIVPAEYTTYFRSVIVFGRIREITDREEILRAIRLLGRRYNPNGSERTLDEEIERHMGGLRILELTVESLTGKAAKELIKREKTNDIS